MTGFTDKGHLGGHPIRKTADITDGRVGFGEVIHKMTDIRMAFPERQPDVCLDKEFPEDFEGIDIDGGFGVEFDVAEDFFRYFISYLSGKRDKHCLCK